MSISPSTVSHSVQSVWNQVGSSQPIVGSAWILSSALYTTYSTTSWLKFRKKEEVSKSNRMELRSIQRPRHSVIENAKNKAFELVRKDRPALLTLYRFSGSLALGLLFPNPINFKNKLVQTINLFPHFILPATFLFFANYFNSISLDKLGISLTYTTKCGIPIFTVLFSILVNGQKAIPKLGVWLSLIPIVIGIATASFSSQSFDLLGFVFAVTSCISQSALNVSSKKVLSDINVTGAEAQRVMVTAALIFMTCLVGIKSLKDYLSLDEREEIPKELETVPSNHPPLLLSLMAVTAYHFEYVLSFVFVSLTDPISYALSDAMRRLLVILAGKAMFGGDKLSNKNKCGIGLAVFGAMMYAINK